VDENRTVNTLRDEIGLEIERVLAIDPAPDLKVRVLARIEHERTSHGWWAPWALKVGGIAMAALMAVFFISRGPDQGLQDEQPGVTRTVDLPPDTAGAVQAVPPITAGVRPRRIRPASPVPPAAATMESAVLISHSETAALRLLVASIHDGRINPTILDDLQPTAAPLEPLSEIAIQPITIEPLARLELLEGAPQ
jgi:hypothetical protein